MLRTLAERIAAGDVDHPVARLPVPLHRPFEDGKAGSADRARAMALEQFLDRVAERGVARQEAERCSRAVFAVLHDAVGRKEVVDIDVRLSNEYHRLLAHV